VLRLDTRMRDTLVAAGKSCPIPEIDSAYRDPR